MNVSVWAAVALALFVCAGVLSVIQKAYAFALCSFGLAVWLMIDVGVVNG